MYIDRIDIALPEERIQNVLSAFLSAETLLQPLPSVSKAERKRLAKLGLKNEALALQIIEVGRSNPDLIPRGINFEKIDRDLVAREQLRTLKIVLERLLGKVTDSMLLSGVDLYAAALSIYHCLRRNADSAGLKETVDELKKGFARPSRKKKRESEAAPVPVLIASPAPMYTPAPSALPASEPKPALAAASPKRVAQDARSVIRASGAQPVVPASTNGMPSRNIGPWAWQHSEIDAVRYGSKPNPSDGYNPQARYRPFADPA